MSAMAVPPSPTCRCTWTEEGLPICNNIGVRCNCWMLWMMMMMMGMLLYHPKDASKCDYKRQYPWNRLMRPISILVIQSLSRPRPLGEKSMPITLLKWWRVIREDYFLFSCSRSRFVARGQSSSMIQWSINGWWSVWVRDLPVMKCNLSLVIHGKYDEKTFVAIVPWVIMCVHQPKNWEWKKSSFHLSSIVLVWTVFAWKYIGHKDSSVRQSSIVHFLTSPVLHEQLNRFV